MSDVFVVASTDGGRLEFHAIQRHDEYGCRIGAYDVVLTTARVSARLWAYYSELTGWWRFFNDLATHWQGWEGEKTRNDNQVHVACTMDRTGHITMKVALFDASDLNPWRVEATLRLEAGQLEGLASAAAQHFGDDSAPFLGS